MYPASRRAAIVILFIILQLPLPAVAAPLAAKQFLILYSNSVNGEIEPCG